jgi:uncharacterized coiled-coil DUF342 family protein
MSNLQELIERRDSIRAASTPLRATRDDYVNRTRQMIASMDVEIKMVERGLFELEMEIGRVAKANGGRH